MRMAPTLQIDSTTIAKARWPNSGPTRVVQQWPNKVAQQGGPTITRHGGPTMGGPTVAQQWPNGGPTVAQRYTNKVAQQWPNKVAQQWPNKVAQHGGPTVVQRGWPNSGPTVAQRSPESDPQANPISDLDRSAILIAHIASIEHACRLVLSRAYLRQQCPFCTQYVPPFSKMDG